MVSGAVLLTASTLICKIIGLLFKIPIINIVGIDGMAYFSSAYNLYMLLNSIAAAGLPVALSILVSKNVAGSNYANIRKIFKVSLLVFLILGITGTFLLYFGADAYADIIGIPKTAPAVKAIAPTLLFICISGAIRGYFQGFEIMAPTAVSQLIESLGKLVLGVGLAAYCVKIGTEPSFTAAAAVLGLSAGVLISVIYLLIRLGIYNKKIRGYYSLSSGTQTDSINTIFRDLLIIALPVTVSSCVTSLTSLADTALITNRLVYGGFSLDAAVSLYSSYTNLAIPLFNLPPALITAVGVSLIPALAGAVARGSVSESKKAFSVALRLSLMLALPASAGMAVFAKPILTVIYPAEIESCVFAAPLLSVLSAAIVFSCLITVCNATLQAYMKPHLPIISMAIGAIIKIVVEYILVGSDIGIYGAPISTVVCTFTILMIDIAFITRFTPQRLSLISLAKIMAATAVSIGLSALLYRYLLYRCVSLIISLAFSIAVAVLLYAVLVLLFKVVTYEDISGIKIFKPIAALLIKLK
jgi:stage V sporulation protein B